ncbi:ABC transporter permease [Tautonia sociabilis]|nr:ABC transporter permease [Tautonia sociabilis]
MATQVSSPMPQVFPPGGDALSGANWIGTIARDARDLYRFRAVLKNLVAQDFRLRYHRSVLGFLWTLLNPILMMAVLSVVFSQFFKFDNAGNYAIYLFSGLVPWSMLYATVSEGAICVIANEPLIRKIYIPKLVFPITRVLLNAATLVLSMGALFLLMVPLGARLTAPLLLLPLAITLFATFALGIALITATVNTFYRDFGHLLTVVLQAWYFATPIIYPVNTLPPEVAWRFWLNPAYPFIRFFQTIIHDGQWPSWALVCSSAGIAAVVLGIGYVTFKCYEDKLVFRL